MFVLNECQKAVQNSDSPYMGIALAVVLVIVVAFGIWSIIDGGEEVMRDYADMVERLRESYQVFNCPAYSKDYVEPIKEAADAIEELLKAAKAMHTWIYLYTGDEQAAYDECGLSDEMNTLLWYGGKMTIKMDGGEA